MICKCAGQRIFMMFGRGLESSGCNSFSCLVSVRYICIHFTPLASAINRIVS